MDYTIYEWGDARRFNSYSAYFRRIFGTRVQKVTIDAGFSCPNRDGTVGEGGCTFCNNDAFSPSYCRPEKSVGKQIEEGIEFHSRRYSKACGFLAYFQAYSNTHKPLEELIPIYREASEAEGIVGIVVGTRPDCVDAEKLDFFAELSKKQYVVLEYGIESCYDATLRRINRGHDFAAAAEAIRMTAERGIHVGAHFILGLPGESRQMMIDQTALINSLPIETVKFHQLQIFKDTQMAADYDRDPSQFDFFELDEYIDFFCDILSRLRPDIVVERFAGEAPPRYHARSSWGLVRNERLLQLLEKRLEERDLWQGKFFETI